MFLLKTCLLLRAMFPANNNDARTTPLEQVNADWFFIEIARWDFNCQLLTNGYYCLSGSYLEVLFWVFDLLCFFYKLLAFLARRHFKVSTIQSVSWEFLMPFYGFSVLVNKSQHFLYRNIKSQQFTNEALTWFKTLSLPKFKTCI